MKKTKIKLSTILRLAPYMKIVIDDEVEEDENGYLLINVGYLRVSTDKQAEEGFGLEVQENDVVHYAKKNDFKNLVLFIDDGYTGTNMDRPALQAIIRLIKEFNDNKTKIRIESFVIPKIDRLGRTLLGTLQFIQDYIVCAKDSKSSENNNKEDINFISVAENYCRIEKDNPQSKFLLMLFASLAEFDRDLIVQKMNKGKVARIASGKWMGGATIPYGYKYDKDTGTLIVIPEQAEKIKEIFRLYLEEHKSPASIAKILGFKAERIVYQILRRKSLTGCIIYKGKEYQGLHEAIIPLELWEETQLELASRSVVHEDKNYLLSGLLFCAHCGAKFRYQQWNKKTGEAKVYCYSKQKSRASLIKDENCPSDMYWASDIEDAVVEHLFKLSFIIDKQLKKQEGTFDPSINLKAELDTAKRKLDRLYSFEIEDEEDEILKEKISTLRAKIKKLKMLIESEDKKKAIVNKVNTIQNAFKTLQVSWNELSKKDKQIICQTLIEKVIIHNTGKIDVCLKLSEFYNIEDDIL